ncbi:DUF1467 family protein [Phreatobacter sp.]|uniref:DUF1467 family protein n=1 Tax=Phreatobacter sp. TaxID=1966341 RepID=UPI003F72C247
MTLPAALAIYFIIWWLTLFAILPFGIRSQIEAGAVVPGSDGGAPSRPGLAAKVLWTTLVSGVIFGLYYANYVTGYITLEDLPAFLRGPAV